MEQVTGIKPASLEWKSRVLSLNYTCLLLIVLVKTVSPREGNYLDTAGQTGFEPVKLLLVCSFSRRVQ